MEIISRKPPLREKKQLPEKDRLFSINGVIVQKGEHRK